VFCVSLAAWISQIKAEKVCFAPVTGLQTPLLENSYSFMKPNLSIQEPHKVGFISLNNVISLISLKVSTVQKRHTMIDHEELLLYGGSESFIEVDFLSPPPISTFPQGKCLQSVPGQQLTRSRSTADRLTLPYWIFIWTAIIYRGQLLQFYSLFVVSELVEMLGNQIDQELSADFKAIQMLTWLAFWFCTKNTTHENFLISIFFFAYIFGI